MNFLQKLFIATLAISVIFMAANTKSVYSQTANFTTKDAVQTPNAVTTVSEKTETSGDNPAAVDTKELEETQKAKEQAIKENKEAVEKVKQEAEKVLKEKEAIEKEAQLKEEAAGIAEKEAELLKKEAKLTKDPEALKKAKELENESERLKKEASLAKEKLSVAELKAKNAETSMQASLKKIEVLEKELEAVKTEKINKMPIIEKTIRVGFIILVGIFLMFLLKFSIKKFEKIISQKDAIREAGTVLRLKTVGSLFIWLGNILIFGTVAFMVLEYFGLNMAPLLAGAGIVGLAFGFGGQYLIRDLINGLFILIEDQYRVNDVVKINEYGGLVENINLRITSLRDLEGRVIIIPNGEVKTVVNFTKEYAQALFDIGVAYKENVDKVIEVIKEIGAGMRKDPYFKRLILDDLEMFGVDDFGDSQVTIKFRIKTLPIKQWEVSREFKRRLKNRFDELGIEIPFPHRTVYWGAGSDNDWMRNFAEQVQKKNS
ncbi:MAG: mechanosensitive ion channel [Candidatus Omnitrophica bacterium]|nr:mechanosensitive ion channel [Candidatus Omnitrophota bacterium]